MMKKISKLAYHTTFLIPELTNQYLLTMVQQPYSLQKKRLLAESYPLIMIGAHVFQNIWKFVSPLLFVEKVQICFITAGRLGTFFPVQKYLIGKNRLCMRKKIRPNGPTELQCYDVIKNAAYLQKSNKNAYFEDFSVLMFILFKTQFQKQLPELFCKKRCS